MSRFRVGPLRVDAERQVVYCGTEIIPLAPKPVRALVLLLENAGEVVSREALRATVWDNALVDEAVISRSMSLLRTKLRTYLGEAEVVETISKRGYRYIGTVEIEQAKSAALLPQPEAESPAVSPPVPPPALRRRSPALLASVVLLLVTLAGWLLWRHSAHAVTTQRPAVALLGMHDLGGTDNTLWLGSALEDTLSTELSRENGASVIAPDRTHAAEQDLDLPRAHTPSLTELGRASRRLNADILSGSYLVTGTEVRLDLALYNERSGRFTARFSDTVPVEQLGALVSRAGASLRTSLGLRPSPAALPPDFFARDRVGTRLYVRALALLEKGDRLEAAQQMLSQAVAASPDMPGAHAALSRAWHLRGYEHEAMLEAGLALSAAGHAPKEQRSRLEAEAFSELRSYPEAIERFEQLHRSTPDNAEDTLALAGALLAENRLDAATTLLRSPPPGLRDDARLPLALAQVSVARGNLKQALVLTGDAAKLAEAKGDQASLAAAMEQSGIAWSGLAHFDESLASFARAEQLYRESGNRRGQISTLIAEGTAMQHSNDPRKGDIAQQALAQAQQTGDPDLMARALLSLGNIQLTTDQTTEAMNSYRQALALAQKFHAPATSLRALAMLGSAAYGAGDLEQASTYTRQARQLAQQSGADSEAARSRHQLAEIARSQGALPQAEAGFRAALEDWHTLGQVRRMNDARFELGEVQLQEGKLLDARQTFALVDTHAMSTGNISLLRTEQARLTAALGEVASAERQALASAEVADSPQYKLQALLLLGQLQLDQHHLPAAEHTFAAMAAVRNGIPADRTARFQTALLHQQLAMEAAPASSLATDRQDLLDQARRLKDREMLFEAQLQEASYLCQVTRNPAALKSLRTEAQNAGYGLLAEQASRVARKLNCQTMNSARKEPLSPPSMQPIMADFSVLDTDRSKS